MRTVDKQSSVAFQSELINAGIDDFAKIDFPREGEINVLREKPSPLQIQVIANQAPPPLGLVGQLLVISPLPRYEIRNFGEDVDAITSAFEKTWPVGNRQIISCDSTVRVLYQSSTHHAFQEIWETFLGKTTDSLSALQKPVMGGGIRFVMPPESDGPEGVLVEVKIESWLEDTSQIFIESQYRWNPPLAGFDSINRIEQVYNYIEKTVVPFVMGE